MADLRGAGPREAYAQALLVRALIRSRAASAWALADELAENHVERCAAALADEALSILMEPPVPEIGAMEQWRRELQQGVGGQHADRPWTWRLDALWQAAAFEAAARDYDRDGLYEAANQCRLRAAQTLVRSAA